MGLYLVSPLPDYASLHTGLQGAEQMNSHARGRTAIAFLPIIFVSMLGCSRTDPEIALREAVTQMEAAVKARDTSKLISYLAPEFKGLSMNRDEAKRTLAALFFTNPNVYVGTTIHDLKITGPSASARVVVIAGGGSGIIPERAQSWDFVTRWRYDGGKWLVESAETEQPSGS
jgi:hypothetical protein